MKPEKTVLTYYDLCDLQYSSYFLIALAQNQMRIGYNLEIAKRAPALVMDLPFDEHWRGFLRRLLLFRVSTNDDDFYFCIDPRDPYDPDAYGAAYHLPLLKTVRYYFKVNYHQASLHRSSTIKPFLHKIQPVSPFLPLHPTNMFTHFPPILNNPCGLWPLKRKLLRIRDLQRLLNLSAMRQLRSIEHDIDIFFAVMIRGDPVHREYNEFRYELVRKLLECRRLNAIVGFVNSGHVQDKFRTFEIPRYKEPDYLRFQARARVSIYVRGLFDCFSFKFAQLLALGKPVVGQPIHNQQETLNPPPNVGVQFAYEAPDAIVAAALELLNSTEQRRHLSLANASYFDSHLDPRMALDSMLASVFDVRANGFS